MSEGLLRVDFTRRPRAVEVPGVDPRQRVIGVDIGGSKSLVFVCDLQGRRLWEAELESRTERGFADMFERLNRAIDDARAKFPEVAAIGISVGGPMTPDGRLKLCPHLPGWEGQNVPEAFRQRHGLTVGAGHDSKLGALASAIFGNGQGAQKVIFLTCGTGIGAGKAVKVPGDPSPLAYRIDQGWSGEIGGMYIAGDRTQVRGTVPGALEEWASGRGMALRAAQLHSDVFDAAVTTRDLAELAKADPRALDALGKRRQERAVRVLEEGGAALGTALGTLLQLESPATIVLGHVPERVGDVFVAPMERELNAKSDPKVRAGSAVVNTGVPQIGHYAALSAAYQALGYLAGDDR